MTENNASNSDGGRPVSPDIALGITFVPSLPPEQLRGLATAAEESGLDELWVWEDCFKESGIASATAALAWTSRIRVGIGLLPVPLRNVALTAMELATMERMFPGPSHRRHRARRAALDGSGRCPAAFAADPAARVRRRVALTARR